MRLNFFYADNLILIALTKCSLYTLYTVYTVFDICTNYSREYQVVFNPKNCKLLVFGNGQNCDVSVAFEGQTIKAQAHKTHLGHLIGKCIYLDELGIFEAKHDI